MRIVFMGSPDFAVPSLQILQENGYQIVGVVTATDKWGGRGNKKLLESAVKTYAKEAGLPVLQPKNLKAPEFVAELAALKPDLQVVVAFRMLPEVVWSLPTIGTFNLHGSLLPKYRGAAPINWAIIEGERETGVTTFFIKHEIDTGDVLLQDRLEIEENETFGELYDRMKKLGARAVLKTVQLIETGNYTLLPQDHQAATKAPKIFHEDCRIDFEQSARRVHNFIRGLSPHPAAWTLLDGLELKIYESRCDPAPPVHPPGAIDTDQRKYLRFATKDGYVSVLELQLQGRKRMRVRDFLNGYTIEQTN